MFNYALQSSGVQTDGVPAAIQMNRWLVVTL
jgi:hypothetical protein